MNQQFMCGCNPVVCEIVCVGKPCDICYEIQNEFYLFKCDHAMCVKCWKEFDQYNCHMCRREFKPKLDETENEYFQQESQNGEPCVIHNPGQTSFIVQGSIYVITWQAHESFPRTIMKILQMQ